MTPPIKLPGKKEQENNRKLEIAATEFYSGLQKERRSPGFWDILVFHAQKVSFGIPGLSLLLIIYWNEKGWLNPKIKYYVNVLEFGLKNSLLSKKKNKA